MRIRLNIVGRQTMLTDRPKLLGNPAAVTARLAQLHEPHISPLTRFVETLRTEAGPGAAVPYFDPWDGGIGAEVLLLFEAPGPKAVKSSFISRNNPDETAKNFFELSMEAGLDRKITILWNAVPWYIGSGTKIRAATAADLASGLGPLRRLLQLLPQVRTIVLVGKKAEKASSQLSPVNYKLFSCPHPSPMFVNHAPDNRGKILTVLKRVRESVVQQGAPADVLASRARG